MGFATASKIHGSPFMDSAALWCAWPTPMQFQASLAIGRQLCVGSAVHSSRPVL